MCDTFVSLSSYSKDKTVIFGKNSDRLESEPQLITHQPRLNHEDGEMLKCTYISIPQVAQTAEIILSQPFFIWGAEMGANEYGVVIGNEAVATKEPLKEIGLLGMDLLRLGLERGKSAKEALSVIIENLEKYGQGGAHNLKGLNYHNSYIIADNAEAFVLEASGDWWIVEFVKGYRSISNNISIRGKGDMRREGIIQHAIEKGYCRDDEDFDFKLIFSPSSLPDQFPIDSRDGCSLNQLATNKGNITPHLMMTFLREHDVGICMHMRNNQSVGSQVSHLKSDPKRSLHWFTGTTIPCLSIFKPYAFPIENQKIMPPGPYNEIDADWIWVQHSKYIKQYKKNPTEKEPARDTYYSKLRNIENKLISQVDDLLNENLSDHQFLEVIQRLNKEAWQKSMQMIQ
jgi:secernin